MSKVGVVVVAILLVVTGIGIAQAGESHKIGEFMEWQTVDQGSPSSPTNVAETHTMGEFMEWQTAGQGGSSSPYGENRPVLAFEDSSSPYAVDRPVLSFEDVMQLENPIETGSLPEPMQCGLRDC